jgi:hypothetical protein
VFHTECSEPASGVAQYVLNARRCELGYPNNRKYNNKDMSIACDLTSDTVHPRLEPCDSVSIPTADLSPTREVLHGCHLSHRCRCDHREDPCCDVNVSQALSIGQGKFPYDRCCIAHSSAAIKLANARRAGGSSVLVSD